MAKQSVQVKTLDKTFSRAVRESYDHTCAFPNCPECGNVPRGADDCSHYRRRRHSAGRWYPDNCVALCRQKHSYLDTHQEDQVDFMREHLGETRFEFLMFRLQTPCKYMPHDRWKMNRHYETDKKRIETLRMDGEQGYIPLVSYD